MEELSLSGGVDPSHPTAVKDQHSRHLRRVQLERDTRGRRIEILPYQHDAALCYGGGPGCGNCRIPEKHVTDEALQPHPLWNPGV